MTEKPRPARIVSFARAALLAAMAVGLASACPAKSSQKNISRGPVDTGPGSLASMRQQLKGTWVLQQFQVRNPSGQMQTVRASGTLECDDFGNVKVDGNLIDPLPQSAGSGGSVLSYTGRIVIDAAKKEFRLDDAAPTAPVNPALAATVGPSLVRKFEVAGNQLKIHFVDPAGTVVADTTFQRR